MSRLLRITWPTKYSTACMPSPKGATLIRPAVRSVLGARSAREVGGYDGEQYRRHHAGHAHIEMEEQQGSAKLDRNFDHYVEGQAAEVVTTLHFSATNSERDIDAGRDGQQHQVMLCWQVEIRLEVSGTVPTARAMPMPTCQARRNHAGIDLRLG